LERLAKTFFADDEYPSALRSQAAEVHCRGRAARKDPIWRDVQPDLEQVSRDLRRRAAGIVGQQNERRSLTFKQFEQFGGTGQPVAAAH
jgi:hypothetical protein